MCDCKFIITRAFFYIYLSDIPDRSQLNQWIRINRLLRFIVLAFIQRKTDELRYLFLCTVFQNIRNLLSFHLYVTRLEGKWSCGWKPVERLLASVGKLRYYDKVGHIRMCTFVIHTPIMVGPFFNFYLTTDLEFKIYAGHIQVSWSLMHYMFWS